MEMTQENEQEAQGNPTLPENQGKRRARVVLNRVTLMLPQPLLEKVDVEVGIGGYSDRAETLRALLNEGLHQAATKRAELKKTQAEGESQ